MALGAQHEGLQQQTDTYFRVPAGRLKLRVIEGKPAVLIGYHRPDEPGVRGSDYYLVPVPDPELLLLALRAALGVRGTVRKQRDIWHWHNVRIHLDEVDKLGRFLELEAVLTAEADEGISRQRLQHLKQTLGMSPEEIAGSYADLLGLE